MSVKNKAVVEQVNAGFARGDIDAVLRHCTDDFVWTMVGDRTVKGKPAIREWMGSMPSEAPAFSVDAVVGDGDFVTAFGEMRMKDKDGSLAGYAYCDVYRFTGDRIAELRAFVIKTDRASG